MASLAAGSIDLIVTDPPYVIGAVSAGSLGSKAGGWQDMMNSAPWFASWYRQAASLLRHNGAMWSFCNWRSLPVVMRAATDAGLPITSMMVWDKEWIGPGGSQGLRPAYELCGLFAKPDFAIPDRGIPDVWRHKTGGHKPNGHPAEKPVDLMRKIIRVSANAGLVLDPFMGSGTTLVAAQAEGVRAIGIEAEEKWCELAAKRLSQGGLFEPTESDIDAAQRSDHLAHGLTLMGAAKLGRERAERAAREQGGLDLTGGVA
jgi:site-specific DNA-methyltransferase (adenine-specific)